MRKLAASLSAFLLVAFYHSNCMAVMQRTAEQGEVRKDLGAILSEGQLPLELINFTVEKGLDSNVQIACSDGKVVLNVVAPDQEWAPAFYFGLQTLGFLFPHPRIQITPTTSQIFSQCGRTILWKPRFQFRGFHLHTQHPNEWVHGFLMDKPKIALDLIKWLARNGQNILQVKLLKTGRENWKKHTAPLLSYAQKMGLTVGIDVAFASLQQKAFRLLDVPYFMAVLSSVSGAYDEEIIQKTIRVLNKELPFDYMSADMGMSEFTPTDFERTLGWIEAARKALYKLNRQLFLKMHVSTGQDHPKYGNFNFLPQFSHPTVGTQPHTVMFYGLRDKSAPVYGRTDFSDLMSIMQQEKQKRSQWYFPETSYWVGIDIDVPLLLTDYLLARSDDMDIAEQMGLEGHVNFTSGQELGYWLMDWTVALLNNEVYKGRPLIGLELLGEPLNVWRPIVEFQNKHFKVNGLISILSSSNLMDEVPGFKHQVLKRRTMKDLSGDTAGLKIEIDALESALRERPPIEGIRNQELRAMMRITWLRMEHAYHIRKALHLSKTEKITNLHDAWKVRTRAKAEVENVLAGFQRYPEARVSEKHKNLTSYEYGYIWTAKTLHFWEREEEMIRTNNYSPFFMNIYKPLDLIF